MIGFGMKNPVLNEPRHEWYQKQNHVRIPKIGECKWYLDEAFTGGGGPAPIAPLVIAPSINNNVVTVTITGGDPVDAGGGVPAYYIDWGDGSGANYFVAPYVHTYPATSASYLLIVSDNPGTEIETANINIVYVAP
jgi:hypothetical protein